MIKYLFLIWISLWGGRLWAQAVPDSSPYTTTDTQRRSPVVKKKPVARLRRVADSARIRDSIRARLADTSAGKSLIRDTAAAVAKDTVQRVIVPPVVVSKWRSDTFLYTKHPFFSFTNPVRQAISERKWQGKDLIFYALVTLFIFFAIIKNGFYRYLQDLFNVFFRTTIRQRQAKDQLIQSPLPSLLLNLFFILSIGMFLTLLFQYLQLGKQFSFWFLYLYCIIGLAAIYGLKFICLKFLGWIFQVSEATDSYIFIVFTTNKIIGIVLLPFLIVLAFAGGLISQVAMTLSLIVIFGLLIYRFFLSYMTVRRQVEISFFHFFLYLCAFELIPLLLINKLLFMFLMERS